MAVGVLAAVFVGFAVVSNNRVIGDVPVYEAGIRRVLAGAIPWVDFHYEYPPLSLALSVLPALASDAAGFRFLFLLEMLMLHTALGWILLREGQATLSSWRGLLPFGLLTLSAICLEYLYLKRFDVAPALATVLAVLAVRDERYGWAMSWLMVGVGLKLYPIVLWPVIAVSALRRHHFRAALLGTLVGAVPLASLWLLGFPWWKVVTFHSGRGLQAESLGASLLWLGHHLGLIDAQWITLEKWTEVFAPSVPWLQRLTSTVLAVAVASSVVKSSWFVWKASQPSLADVSRAVLVPLLALLAWSSVLSPQFLIWIVALCGLSMTDGRWRTGLWCCVMVLLVPLFFPSRDYEAGLKVLSTSALVLRNLVLVVAWVDTWRQLKVEAEPRGATA